MIDLGSPLGMTYERKKEEDEFYPRARFYPVTQVLEWLQNLGYENLTPCQTLFEDLLKVTEPKPVKEGHVKGGFAVIAAQKSADR
jgi:hypothetical protein